MRLPKACAPILSSLSGFLFVAGTLGSRYRPDCRLRVYSQAGTLPRVWL